VLGVMLFSLAETYRILDGNICLLLQRSSCFCLSVDNTAPESTVLQQDGCNNSVPKCTVLLQKEVMTLYQECTVLQQNGYDNSVPECTVLLQNRCDNSVPRMYGVATKQR
jgi:hypothetical protein